jgi:hypothetical protein
MAAGSRRLGAAARDPDWQACADHELDEVFNRELVDVAVHDLADCRLRNFEGARSLGLTPALAIDVMLERRSQLATNVQRCSLFRRKTQIEKRIAAHGVLAVRNADLLHAGTNSGQPFAVARLEAHLDAGQLFTQHDARALWKSMRELAGISLPAFGSALSDQDGLLALHGECG